MQFFFAPFVRTCCYRESEIYTSIYLLFSLWTLLIRLPVKGGGGGGVPDLGTDCRGGFFFFFVNSLITLRHDPTFLFPYSTHPSTRSWPFSFFLLPSHSLTPCSHSLVEEG